MITHAELGYALTLLSGLAVIASIALAMRRQRP